MPDRAATHAVRTGRLGWAGYAAILRALHDSPQSAIALAPSQGMRQDTTREVLRQMRALDLVHISGFVRAERNHLSVPVWSYGPGTDVELDWPTNRPRRPGTELVAVAAMLRALAAGPQSVKDLVKCSGGSRDRVGLFIRVLRRDLRMVCIADWRKVPRHNNGGAPAPFYALAFDAPDVKRPRPQTMHEYWRNARERKRAKALDRKHIARLAAEAFVFTASASLAQPSRQYA